MFRLTTFKGQQRNYHACRLALRVSCLGRDKQHAIRCPSSTLPHLARSMSDEVTSVSNQVLLSILTVSYSGDYS